MAKAAVHGLRNTPGTFQMRGIVSDVKRQNFYNEKDFGTSNMRTVNFGVKYDTDKKLYTTVQGFSRPSVYFSKRNKETGKTETKQVGWADRITFTEKNPEWNIIGCNIGLRKGEDGQNIKKHLTEYDAAKYIKDNICDDMSVFVRGNLEFRSYINKNNEVKRITNFSATQVSLCGDVVFGSEGFEPMHEWTQELVYTGIERETDADGNQTGRFIMSGYVVSYNAIEPVSFVVENAKFATNVKKKLKPYNSIQCHGKIEVVHVIEEVVETSTDEWGDENKMTNQRTNGASYREMICTGADPSTITTDDFSEEAITEGIKKLKAKDKVEENFGEKKEAAKGDDGWGDNDSVSGDEDEIEW